MKTITTFLLALLATATLFAQPYPADDYELSDDKLTLVNWTGNQKEVNMQADPILKNIKHIGKNVFMGKNELSSITFPENLESIGEGAFFDCSGLTGTLTIPDRVTSIGVHAFDGCFGFTALIIPNSVTSIGKGAFRRCSGFEGSLTIPNSVTSVGDQAFERCSGFTGALTIPSSITSIGNWVFFSCSGFTALTIPNSVTSIGEVAFFSCSGLKGELIIPNSVTSIGNQAFYNCSSLTGTLTIPNSVTSIGDFAFGDCSGFTAIRILSKKPPKVTNSNAGLNTDLPLIVPEGSLEEYKNHDYWNKFTSITEHSISDSYELSADSTTLLRWKGEEETVDMQAYKILKKIKHIAKNAFAKPNDGTNKDIGKNYDENKTLKTIIFPEGLETIGDHAFVKCTALSGNLTIPNTVTSIGVHAFRESAFSGTLTIPNSVKKIATGAFAYCSGFTELAIGDSLKKISDYAFYSCSGLRGDLRIGEKIEEIGTEAFYQCTGLDGSLIIEKNVKNIGEKAFIDCPFTAINVLATTPPTVQKNNAGLNTTLPLTVPEGSLEEYKNHDYWKKFASITDLAVPSSINKVEATANELRFYPSPVKNLLTVDCEKAIEAYALYSSTGVLLQSKKTKDKQLQIDMENYPSGIYFLRLLIQEEGAKTIKLIKR